MLDQTAFAFTGFVTWTLLLLIVMEALRGRLVFTRAIQPNGFVPDNSNLSPFMQRLARAHLNCIEGLPIFGGLMLIAIATGRTSVTDSLALVFLIARVLQSICHLASLSNFAVNARFAFFLVQMVIGTWWAYLLLIG